MNIYFFQGTNILLTFSIKPAFFGSSQVALVAKNLSASAGDERHVGLIPGSGRYPGEGKGNPLHDSCLANPMDRGAWWVPLHKVTKIRTQVKQLSTPSFFYHNGGKKIQKEVFMNKCFWKLNHQWIKLLATSLCVLDIKQCRDHMIKKCPRGREGVKWKGKRKARILPFRTSSLYLIPLNVSLTLLAAIRS